MKGLTGKIAIFICFLAGQLQASDLTPDGFTVSYGQYLSSFNSRSASYDLFRLGVNWNISEEVFKGASWKLDSYSQFSASRWNSKLDASDNPSPDGKGQVNVLSFSPVFRLTGFNAQEKSIVPFLDFGVGAAWLSEVDLEKEKKSPINMGGHWQFEIRLVPGIKFGSEKQYALSYGWFHYSNAGINPQNEAMDFHVLSFEASW